MAQNDDQTWVKVGIGAAVVVGLVVLYNWYSSDPDAQRAVQDIKGEAKGAWNDAKSQAASKYDEAKAKAR